MTLADRVQFLVAAVRAAGGAMRSTSAITQGHSQWVIDAAIQGRLLTRVRRVWLAVPDADPNVLRAARGGVVLTCVTQAQRLGLWVLRADRIHVAAGTSQGRVDVPAGTAVHWSRPLVPRSPDTVVDSVENVLCLTASCVPHDEALAVWESALRKGLVDRPTLARLNLSATARRLLEEANPFADSGLESFVPPRLRWLGLRIIPQAWIAGHRVDFLIGDRLILQIDGAHHVGVQRTSDISHDAALMLAGYHVLRVGYDQVVHRWPEVQDLLMRAVAQGLHRAA
ncbi:DUF559 domain-containing protein [Microbacterium sp. 4R-513]|uniref:endonuclease domain-containing protein n=1 Tax=Microbacterium sp. 4R-513 TaxID=2567934 RepID=UPI0013E10864|nr:DUF559 domain-containing protein [Microbacterium sp. 4R-513]QIG40552.1 DUF559 domain-containing protein [Microbacterium sp. 4R-513]